MIIADTGFFLALANSRDQHHALAVETLRHLKRRLVSTWPVMTETCHLLAHRVGEKSVDSFLALCHARAFEVAAQGVEHVERMRELMRQYAGLPMDLADASLVMLAETLGTGEILSTDRRDFGVYRFKNHRPFKNLLRL